MSSEDPLNDKRRPVAEVEERHALCGNFSKLNIRLRHLTYENVSHEHEIIVRGGESLGRLWRPFG